MFSHSLNDTGKDEKIRGECLHHAPLESSKKDPYAFSRAWEELSINIFKTAELSSPELSIKLSVSVKSDKVCNV